MKKPTLALTFLLTASLASGCIIVADGDSDLTIDNASSYVIEDIAVAGSGDLDYSANLLGRDVLFPNETLTVQLDCDTYDVLIIDETRVSCELVGLDLCFDSAVWVIDNFTLDSCAFAREIPQPAMNTESAKPFSGRVVDLRKNVE